jgi:hypothetical protein
LLRATNGTLHGTTNNNGPDGGGTVFSLSVGLGAFLKTQPTSGKVGAPIVILGNNLSGSNKVTFNGTAAKFTAASNSGITTNIPTGATTGTVEVKTPKKTLNSRLVFRVTK